MLRRIGAALLAALLYCLLLTGCKNETLKKYSVTWFDLFDTVTTVTGYAPSQEEWDHQMDALYTDLSQLHQLFDIYHSAPEMVNLYQLNRTAAQAPVQVDTRLFDLLALAQQMYTVTGGKLDIAQGRVYAIWHDLRQTALQDPDAAALPENQQLISAKSSMENLVLDAQAHTVFFKDPSLQLDVGSVGKGYAVELAAQAAQQRGLTSALLNVGGNLRAIGTKPDGSLWTGGIQNPWQTDGELLSAVELKDNALVTSGDYQRFYTVDGVRYHHLIDPDTLYPARNFSAVAVLAPDSGFADCLSTGLFCMTLEEGEALVQQLDGVEALWMLPNGTTHASAGFEQHLRTR